MSLFLNKFPKFVPISWVPGLASINSEYRYLFLNSTFIFCKLAPSLIRLISKLGFPFAHSKNPQCLNVFLTCITYWCGRNSKRYKSPLSHAHVHVTSGHDANVGGNVIRNVISLHPSSMPVFRQKPIFRTINIPVF